VEINRLNIVVVGGLVLCGPNRFARTWVPQARHTASTRRVIRAKASRPKMGESISPQRTLCATEETRKGFRDPLPGMYTITIVNNITYV